MNVMMDAAGDAEEHPFGDMAYLITAALDPTFALPWVDHDLLRQKRGGRM